MLKIKKPQNGDTLVEVMICIAVIGLALGTGYALTNRSFKYGLSAAERSQAQAIAQGQAEFIKNAALSGTPDQYTSGGAGNFCIYDGNGDGGGSMSVGSIQTSPNVCQNFNGSIYTVRINYAPGTQVFTIKTLWDSTTSSSTNQTTLYYKLGT